MQFKTGLEYINKLRMVVYALLSAPLAVFIVMYLQTNKAENLKPLIPQELIVPVSFGLAILYLGFIVYSYVFFTGKIRSARSEPGLRLKLKKYSTLTIVRFAYLEAAIIACLAGAFGAAEKSFLALFVVLLFIFSVENPSLHRVSRQLRLTKEEKNTLFNKDGIGPDSENVATGKGVQ